MGFSRQQPRFGDAEMERLMEGIKELSISVAQLRGEQEVRERDIELSDRVVELQAEIDRLMGEKTEREIELDRVQEQHARENREIEHKVGLHKQKVDLDIEEARRKTELDVREGNLAAERKQFEEQMRFQQERFSKEVDYLHEVVETILGRIPEVKVERVVRTEERVGDGWDRSDRPALPSGGDDA